MKHIVVLIAGLLITVGMAVAEDGYLKSDGSQYINTGYVIKPTTRIELDIRLDSVGTGEQHLFGTIHNKIGALAFCSYTTPNGKMNYCCQTNASNWRQTAFMTTTDRQTIILDGYHNRYSIVIGGVTNYTEAVTSPHAGCDSGVEVPVLAAYNLKTGARTGKTACKLYSFKIYEEDILVADFKPCLLDGELVFRDSVSGIWRKNAVGNAFTCGGDVESIDGGYIESNGAQYIDTGYKAKANSRIEIDMAFSDLAKVADTYPFGTRNDASGGLNFGMFANGSGWCGWICRDNEPNWGMFSHSASLNRRTFIIDALNRRWSVVAHGTTVSSGIIESISADYAGETYRSLFLFATRLTDSVKQNATMKLYGFRAYENGELVKNFVPCVKGGVVGLKETIDGKFFAGVVPGEAFTASGNVMVEEDDPYVEGHGFQAFATDIYVDSTCRVELDFAPQAVPNEGAKYFLGSTTEAQGNLVFGAYIEKSQLSVNCQRNKADWNAVTYPNPDCRQQLIIDILNRKISHYVNGLLFRSESITADCGTAEDPIVTKYKTPILGNSYQGAEPGNILAARVYGFKLYKNDEPVHDFRPYVKAGVVGMRDEITGTFISTPREVKGFGAGGDIPSDTEGAFLSSDQRQAIDTGYIVKDSSCIEVDFAFNQHTNAEERIFGSTSGGDYRIGVYGDSTNATWGTYRFAANRAGADTVYLDGYFIDVKRRTAIIDIPNKRISLLTGAETNVWRTIATAPQAGDEIWPMGLFGEPADSGFTTAQHLANMRVYSVKIRENGTLVHHYLPYKSGDTVGLKDVVTGAIKTNMTGSEAPFTVGGRGWGEENAAFYEEPVGKALDPDETVTLSAFAPGAVSYQWLKNGEEIEGAVGATYVVSWQRLGLDAEYSVRATFDRYGKAVSSVSAPATVSHKPRGLHVIVR